MYEHMRNAFALELSKIYKVRDIDSILAMLDKTARDYDISEKSTALMVLDDLFPPIAKTYLAVKGLEGLSPASISNYRTILRIFFEAIEKQPQDVSANDIRLFLAEHKARNKVSDRTLDKYRQILNAFFAWATDEEYLQKNPCRNIKEIKYEIKPRRSLTRKQLELLRRACETKRDIAILDVMYSTGCRVAEIANMRKSDIDFSDKSVHIIGKGSKHNVVYLNVNAQLSLETYLQSRADNSDYLFVRERRPFDKVQTRTIEAMFARLSQIVGFDVSPHVIRHTTATLSLQSGMKITEVQSMLGHSSVATTQIYAETSQEDVKHAHEKYVV